MHVPYNLNIAINLRGGEVAEHDFFGNPIMATSISESVMLAGDMNFQWGYHFRGANALLPAIGDRRDLPKKVFKTIYSGYREFTNRR